MRKRRAFTLVEVVIAAAAVVVLLYGVVGIYVLALHRWDFQTSYGIAIQTTGTALEAIDDDARNAISFTTLAEGSNTLYVFTLPSAAEVNGATVTVTPQNMDAVTYIPARTDGVDLDYDNGLQVCYYLSDITGSQTVTGGTILWRATAPAKSSTFTPDKTWSLVNTSQARCSGVQSFSIAASGTDNMVLLTMSVIGASGHQSYSYSVSRDLYEMDHN
jgi:type II secretory pathway pseudopilin PulG